MFTFCLVLVVRCHVMNRNVTSLHISNFQQTKAIIMLGTCQKLTDGFVHLSSYQTRQILNLSTSDSVNERVIQAVR